MMIKEREWESEWHSSEHRSWDSQFAAIGNRPVGRLLTCAYLHTLQRVYREDCSQSSPVDVRVLFFVTLFCFPFAIHCSSHFRVNVSAAVAWVWLCETTNCLLPIVWAVVCLPLRRSEHGILPLFLIVSCAMLTIAGLNGFDLVLFCFL